jgi:hypothetical protein
MIVKLFASLLLAFRHITSWTSSKAANFFLALLLFQEMLRMTILVSITLSDLNFTFFFELSLTTFKWLEAVPPVRLLPHDLQNHIQLQSLKQGVFMR